MKPKKRVLFRFFPVMTFQFELWLTGTSCTFLIQKCYIPIKKILTSTKANETVTIFALKTVFPEKILFRQFLFNIKAEGEDIFKTVRVPFFRIAYVEFVLIHTLSQQTYLAVQAIYPDLGRIRQKRRKKRSSQNIHHQKVIQM